MVSSLRVSSVIVLAVSPVPGGRKQETVFASSYESIYVEIKLGINRSRAAMVRSHLCRIFMACKAQNRSDSEA